MKDFLPLLIGLIWLGFTLYSKNQKKKNSKSGVSAEKKRPSMLEQILLGEQFNSIIQPETELSGSDENYDDNENNEDLEIEQIESFNEKSPFLKYELSDFVKEGTRITNENNNNYEGNEMILEEENDPQLIDFDLKRAIIYSEILHAPYI